MPKKSPPLDDLSKLDTDLKEGSILVIEDGLRLKVKKGRRIFEARYRKNGLYRSKQVGTHPETPIEEVRINMRRFFEEIEAARVAELPAEKITALEGKVRRKAKHSNEEDERFYLHTEAHCWQFIRYLCFTFAGIAKEYQLAILLMLALPARPKDLLTAKWSDIEGAKLCHGKQGYPTRTPLQRSFEFTPYRHFSWISPTCERLLSDLRTFTGKQEYLFPSLAEMSAQERTVKLNSILEDIWTLYPVKISGLQYTFAKLAKAYSEFKPEFIDSLVTKKYKLAPPHNTFYEFQTRSLLIWWGSNLERLQHMDTYISKHDFRCMEFEFTLPSPKYLLI